MICSIVLSSPALANGFQESSPWQFQSSADKVNQAVVQDMIRKKKSGFYAAPVYVTNIDRQYNCNVSASALGNSGTNTTLSHSPSQTGSASNANGNASDTTVNGNGNLPSAPNVNGNQSNSGHVGSSVNGDTDLQVGGNSSQALNSTQTNSGSQSASIGGSNACAFGPLN